MRRKTLEGAGWSDNDLILDLLERGWITRVVKMEIIDLRRRRRDGSLLDLLVENGYLTPEQMEEIISITKDDGDATGPGVPGVTVQPGDLASLVEDCPESPDERYEVVTHLGHGGMGDVVAVHDPALRRRMALKRIRGGMQDRAAVDRFIEEAQVTAQLDHPTIPPVHELVRAEGGEVYYTMKEVKGRTLSDVIHEGDTSFPELLRILVRVAEGIEFAHSRQVRHRDLKPENIMIGGFGAVYIMDWGLAQVGKGSIIDEGESVTTDRSDSKRIDQQTLGSLGTPAYMAPEQARGDGEIDERTDVYLLGAILHEILTGSPPHRAKRGEDGIAFLRRISREPRQVLTGDGHGQVIDREVEAVVLRAMSFDPSDRYPDASAFREDLQAYLDGGLVGVYRYSPAQMLAKWCRRNKVAVIGGLATTVALLVGLVSIVIVLARAEAETLREAEQARLEEKERSDRASAGEARILYEEGRRAGAEAAEIHFNPAAPQDYFRPHVAALSAVGRAIQLHPDPPEAWKSGVAGAALDVQEKAEALGDWAMAQILAENVGAWGAVSREEVSRRLARVDEARRQAVREDEKTLRGILDRIGRAMGDSEESGSVLPGEIPERARRLALRAHPELTAHVIGLLVDGKIDLEAVKREFLIEYIGRSGNVHARAQGLSARELISSRLQEAAQPGCISAIEVASWIRAAARIEARVPGTFPDLAARTTSLAKAYQGLTIISQARVDTAAYLDSIRMEADLPSVKKDRVALEGRIADLSDWFASRVRSGPEMLELLLDMVEDESLPAFQRCFAIGQIGLMGIDSPPDPGNPGRKPSAILRSVFDRTCESPSPGSQKNDAHLHDPAMIACAAASGLSRLGVEGFAITLNSRRLTLGLYSYFGLRTAVSLRLLPPVFSVAETAEEHVNLGILLAEQGDFDRAIKEFSQAAKIKPSLYQAHVNMGNAKRRLGEHAEAIEHLSRAVSSDPEKALGYNLLGLTYAAQGEHDLAIESLSRAIHINPHSDSALNNRGIQYFLSGNLERAIEDYTMSTRINPENAYAFCNRGNAYMEAGDPELSIKDHTRAIEISPHHTVSYVGRAIARKSIDDISGAISDYGFALSINPACVDALRNRGLLLLDQENHKGAIQDFTRLLQIYPNDVDVLDMRGGVYSDLARYEEAIADYSRAIQIKSGEKKYYYNRGISYRRLGDLKRAHDDYSESIRLDPGFADAYTNRGLVLEAMGDMPGAMRDLERALEIDPEHAIAHMSLGHALTEQGDPGSAIRHLSRAIEIDPGCADAYCTRGVARKIQGDVDGAIQDHTRAMEIEPDHVVSCENRGSLFHEQGKLQEALGDFSRAIEIDPDDPRLHASRGAVRLGLGEFSEAKKDFSKAIRLDSEFAFAYSGRGRSRRALGDHDGSISDISRAIGLEPDNADHYILRGGLRHQMGEVKGALADCTAAIKIDPARVDAYSIRGCIRNEMKDHRGAIEDFSRVLEGNPDSARAYSNRGNARGDLGDHRGAIEDYTQAIRIDPENPDAYNGRGWMQYRCGNLARAIRDFTRTIDLDPDDVQAHTNRGLARTDLGEFEGAIADHSRVMELRPGYAMAYNNRGWAKFSKGDIEAAISDYDRAIELDEKLELALLNRGWARHCRGDHVEAIDDFTRIIVLNPNSSQAYTNRSSARLAQGDLQGVIEDCDWLINRWPKSWFAWRDRAVALAKQGENDESRRSFDRAFEHCPVNVRDHIERLIETHLGK